MFTYTTCRACGDTLHTTCDEHGTYNTVHPFCPPQPTKAEQLAQKWLKSVECSDAKRETELQAEIDELDSRPPRLLEAALTYASWGWPVFPLQPLSQAIEIAKRSGEPFDKVAKKPATRNGFKDATTDPDRIRAWWTRHPDSNIGLPTGIAFDVIDIDVPDGPNSLAYILATTVDERTGRGLLPDAHGLCATASGGAHYYIKPQGGGNKASIMAGIDIRGTGGYVVAPPSTLSEPGRSWSWTLPPSPLIKTAAVTA